MGKISICRVRSTGCKATLSHCPATSRVNDFQQDYSRDNSDTQDAKYSGRFAWTPRGQDQYAFSYSNQKAEKGVRSTPARIQAPLSTGFLTADGLTGIKPATIYITNTGLGESNSIKFRAYYDQFNNAMNFYDNADFSLPEFADVEQQQIRRS